MQTESVSFALVYVLFLWNGKSNTVFFFTRSPVHDSRISHRELEEECLDPADITLHQDISATDL